MTMSLHYPFDAAKLRRNKKSLRRTLLSQPGLHAKRIAILGGSTTDEIVDMLELCLLMRGIQPSFYQSAYHQYLSEALDPCPELQQFKPELVYIHTSSVNIIEYPTMTSNEQAVQQLFEQQMSHFYSVWDGVAKNIGCPVIQNNFEEPWHRPLGNLDGSDYRGKSRYIARLNAAFADASQTRSDLHIHDIHYLSARIGMDHWFDPRDWYRYKHAMSMDAIVKLTWHLSAVIAGMLGLAKKCLIVDLDNTLWGGVIGDDGVEGIAIGNDSASAEAHSDLQQYILDLQQRGILLAVCSKNDESNARLGFSHISSVLQETDFAVFLANWNNKPDNIDSIANTLAIATDSMVFLDDNPVERDLIRQQLPSVMVPETGSDITDFIHILDQAALFETPLLSAEDEQRSQLYRDNAERHSHQNRYADYQDFLRSLNMHAIIQPFSLQHLERITQLTNKTNQFNLTTQRHTLNTIRQMAESDQYITLSGHLKDRFGDNGLVSVIAGKISGDNLHIELWLMSCRVLKRNMELAMFEALSQLAYLKGITTLTGYYYPTSKNSLVKHLYRDLGFTLVSDTLASETNRQSVWQIALSPTPQTTPHFITTANR